MVVSTEILYHFNCEECSKWWSISDSTKKVIHGSSWNCPYCGYAQTVTNLMKPNL